jgi:hypothetical protein
VCWPIYRLGNARGHAFPAWRARRRRPVVRKQSLFPTDTSYFIGRTDDTWTEGGGRLTMLGVKGTEVLTFRLPETWASGLEQQKAGKAALMVRRRNVTQTDFAAIFSAASSAIERLPVKAADGKEAQAVGLKITPQGGTPFQVIVSYEPEGTEVLLGDLRSKGRFATDYQD